MNRDDIIRMAKEAGMRKTFVCAKPDDCPDDDDCCHKQVAEGLHGRPEVIERFAALVAAAAREECAKVCEELGYTKHGGWTCAEVIRARGQE